MNTDGALPEGYAVKCWTKEGPVLIKLQCGQVVCVCCMMAFFPKVENQNICSDECYNEYR